MLILHLVVAQGISFVVPVVPVRLIIVLFSTNPFSGILGIFGEELITDYFVLDTFSDNLLVHSHLCICVNS